MTSLRPTLPTALLAALALSACDNAPDVNPPTQPATPPVGVEDTSIAPGGGLRPGRGPESFVGNWAARAAWCGNTTGPERPISITTTRFEGYENVCSIRAIRQTADAYEATLDCLAEGMASTERVRMKVTGERLMLDYPDRAPAPAVTLTRCGPPIQNPPEDSPPINGPEPTG